MGVMCGMCCTLRPAELSKTVLYAGEAMHEGKLVHVLGYQNRTKNRFDGPNAMILPFPASKEMGAHNCMKTDGLRWLMNDLAAAVAHPVAVAGFGRRTRGMTLGSAKSVQVFDSGAYTVVLAEDARDIPSALERVHEAKRPDINEEIFDAYAKWYPNWPIALCCFHSRRELEAEPLIWWYEPKFKHTLFAPGLDAHNGSAPDLTEHVRVDHSVVFGSTQRSRGTPVRFRREVPGHVSRFIADRVVGEGFKTMMANGDFAMPVDKITNLSESDNNPTVKISRVAPSFWTA